MPVYVLRILEENSAEDLIAKLESRIRNFYSHCLKWRWCVDDNDQGPSWRNTIIENSEFVRSILREANGSVVKDTVTGDLKDIYERAYNDAIKYLGEDTIKNKYAIYEIFNNTDNIGNVVKVRQWMVSTAKTERAIDLVNNKETIIWKIKKSNKKK